MPVMKVVVDFILSTVNTVKRYAHGQPAQTSKQRKFKYTWFAFSIKISALLWKPILFETSPFGFANELTIRTYNILCSPHFRLHAATSYLCITPVNLTITSKAPTVYIH